MTMVTFIFFIAAGLTVFNRFQAAAATTTTTTTTTTAAPGRPTAPRLAQERGNVLPALESRVDASNGTGTNSTNQLCLPVESNLAFTFYFFLLLMFMCKLSAIYLNYSHYVDYALSLGRCKLAIILTLILVVPLIFVIVASALHSNPSNKIMAVVQSKLCWFTPEKNHFFLTLPVCLICAAMLVLTILTSKKAWHYRRTDSRIGYRTGIQRAVEVSQMKHRRRRDKAAGVILASGLLQSVVWMTGPLLRIENPTSATALQWIFIIINGLEGVWAILLYLIVRRDGLDENLPSYRRERLINAEEWPMPEICLDEPADRERYETPVERFDDIVQKGKDL